MKYRNQVVLLAIVGAAFGVGRWTSGLDFSSTAQAQPDKKAPAATPTQPAMDPTKMGIGPEHRVLDVLVGDWQGSVTMWMAPGTEPDHNTGTIHREWVLDGHFVHEKVDGGAMGPGGPMFKGMGVTGYNSATKQYEAGWVDNTSTAIVKSTGSYDAAKKTFTYSGERPDGMGHTVKFRDVLDCSSPDREVMASYSTGADGKEFKSFEGTFDRAKK
jgi:hypothetical protein